MDSTVKTPPTHAHTLAQSTYTERCKDDSCHFLLDGFLKDIGQNRNDIIAPQVFTHLGTECQEPYWKNHLILELKATFVTQNSHYAVKEHILRKHLIWQCNNKKEIIDYSFCTNGTKLCPRFLSFHNKHSWLLLREDHLQHSFTQPALQESQDFKQHRLLQGSNEEGNTNLQYSRRNGIKNTRDIKEAKINRIGGTTGAHPSEVRCYIKILNLDNQDDHV